MPGRAGASLRQKDALTKPDSRYQRLLANSPVHHHQC